MFQHSYQHTDKLIKALKEKRLNSIENIYDNLLSKQDDINHQTFTISL